MTTKGKLKSNFLLGAHTESGNQAIFRNSQGQPGIERDLSIMVIQVKEKSGKKFSGPHIIIINSCMFVSKVVVPFLFSKCTVYYFARCCGKYMFVTYVFGSIFFTYFCTYVKLGSDKNLVF